MSTTQVQISDTIPLEPISRNSSGSDPSVTRSNVAGRTLGSSTPLPITYLHGWRLVLVKISLGVGFFLANLETSIVNTALVSITNDLGDFEKAAWIIAAYLLGYVATVIIHAKLSDIFGRKALLVLCFFQFIIFSAACGAAQSTNQLIIFRALKGLGGSGLGTLPIITAYDTSPPRKYAFWATVWAVILALANILGPILGGVISRDVSWRWVFLINVPIAVPFAIIIAVAIPPNFPYQGNPDAPVRSLRALLSSRSTLGRIDFLGSGIILIGTIFFAAAFQGAGKNFAWDSGLVISFLVISGTSFIAFLSYEYFITTRDNGRLEPVFPWRFVRNRVWMGMLFIAFFQGMSWVVPIYQIPQQMEVVHNVNPLGGGLRLLPFTATAPISSMISAAIAKRGIAPVYLLLFASCLQIIGFACLATIPYSAVSGISARQYGFEVIAGVGVGPTTVLLPLMVPFVVQNRDRGVGMAAITQARIMGGVIGLCIVTTAMNNRIRSDLRGVLTPRMVEQVLMAPKMIGSLETATRNMVLGVLNSGFNLQLRIIAGLAGAQVLGCFLIWRSPQIQVTLRTAASRPQEARPTWPRERADRRDD